MEERSRTSRRCSSGAVVLGETLKRANLAVENVETVVNKDSTKVKVATKIDVSALEAELASLPAGSYAIEPAPPNPVAVPGRAFAGSETARNGINGLVIAARAAHVAVDAVRVGPICLDGDGREPFFLDQPARDNRALAIELVRAVCGFAEQDETCIADPVEQVIVVGPVSRETPAQRSDDLRRFTFGLRRCLRLQITMDVRGSDRGKAVECLRDLDDRIRYGQADQLVHQPSYPAAGVSTAYGRGHHDALRAQLL